MGQGSGPESVLGPKFKQDEARDQSSGSEMTGTGTGTSHQDQKWPGPGPGRARLWKLPLSWYFSFGWRSRQKLTDFILCLGRKKESIFWTCSWHLGTANKYFNIFCHVCILWTKYRGAKDHNIALFNFGNLPLSNLVASSCFYSPSQYQDPAQFASVEWRERQRQKLLVETFLRLAENFKQFFCHVYALHQ